MGVETTESMVGIVRKVRMVRTPTLPTLRSILTLPIPLFRYYLPDLIYGEQRR